MNIDSGQVEALKIEKLSKSEVPKLRKTKSRVLRKQQSKHSNASGKNMNTDLAQQ